jgi:hypothetical protein
MEYFTGGSYLANDVAGGYDGGGGFAKSVPYFLAIGFIILGVVFLTYILFAVILRMSSDLRAKLPSQALDLMPAWSLRGGLA